MYSTGNISDNFKIFPFYYVENEGKIFDNKFVMP